MQNIIPCWSKFICISIWNERQIAFLALCMLGCTDRGRSADVATQCNKKNRKQFWKPLHSNVLHCGKSEHFMHCTYSLYKHSTQEFWTLNQSTVHFYTMQRTNTI